ncbi:MAG: PqqD family protein [Prevotella sp.]|nr:PqqD family protein [Prevotella sp.]MDY4040287.1 PqqD family protein [Prevotella sp.]
MKARKGFNLRNVCGEQIIVPEGKENIDCSSIISMNESSAYLWKNIQDKDFTAEDLVRLLMDEYEVDEETAGEDVRQLIRQWQTADLLEP